MSIFSEQMDTGGMQILDQIGETITHISAAGVETSITAGVINRPALVYNDNDGQHEVQRVEVLMRPDDVAAVEKDQVEIGGEKFTVVGIREGADSHNRTLFCVRVEDATRMAQAMDARSKPPARRAI